MAAIRMIPSVERRRQAKRDGVERVAELRLIQEAITAGRCHCITAAEAAAHRAAREATAAARRRSVGMFFSAQRPWQARAGSG